MVRAESDTTKHLCSAHGTEVAADKHLCPEHREAFRQWSERRRAMGMPMGNGAAPGTS
jgi:hypothetical protein